MCAREIPETREPRSTRMISVAAASWRDSGFKDWPAARRQASGRVVRKRVL